MSGRIRTRGCKTDFHHSSVDASSDWSYTSAVRYSVLLMCAFLAIFFRFAVAATNINVDGPARQPGENQMRLGTNAAAAQGDIGITFFTPELTNFNNQQCANGPCQNSILGIAHRSWPLGSCVDVCIPRSNKCAEAIVMDRGPGERLRQRTIDANPALTAQLGLSGIEQATYKLISLSDKPCNAGRLPDGSIQVSGYDPYNLGNNGDITGSPTNVGYPTGGTLSQALAPQQQFSQQYPQQAYNVQQPASVQPSQSFIPPPPIQGQISVLSNRPIQTVAQPVATLQQTQPKTSIADELISLLVAPTTLPPTTTTQKSTAQIDPADAVTFVVGPNNVVTTVPAPVSVLRTGGSVTSQTFVSTDMSANQLTSQNSVQIFVQSILTTLKETLIRILQTL